MHSYLYFSRDSYQLTRDNWDIEAIDSLYDYRVYHHLYDEVPMVFSNLTINCFHNIRTYILLSILLIFFYEDY